MYLSLEHLLKFYRVSAAAAKLWQAFVAVKECRVKKYYQGLVASDTNSDINVEHKNKDSEGNFEAVMDTVHVPEKWKAQTEKDLPRTFRGHPALDDNGRNALRRLLRFPQFQILQTQSGLSIGEV